MTSDYPPHASHHPPPDGGHPSRGTKRQRGGRRPGAGAPRGNLNALKHGRRSRQFAEIGAIVAAVPQARDTLLALDRRRGNNQRRADEVAALWIAGLYAHAKDIAQGKPSRGPFERLRRLMDDPKALSAPLSNEDRERLNEALEQIAEEGRETQISAPHNQPVAQQSESQYEITPD